MCDKVFGKLIVTKTHVTDTIAKRIRSMTAAILQFVLFIITRLAPPLKLWRHAVAKDSSGQALSHHHIITLSN